MSSQASEQDEREQIQDDIERLQLALQEEDEYEDTDDENVLHIDQDYIPDYDDGSKPGPSGIITYEQAEEEDEETADIQLGAADLAQLQMVGEDGEIVINPETCLALNRAYQEILLDLLRKIEISLQENRNKQTTLEEELSVKSGRKNISSSDSNSVIKPLTWFRVPFFRDVNGRHAPQNEDVELKKTLGEIRQDHLYPVLWYRGQRDLLKEAVKREAQEKLIRPLMNKKEVEAEKHLLADKNKKSKVKKEIEANLKDIDLQIEDIRSYNLETLVSKLKIEDIDWMKISNIDFFGKHGPEDCKKFWVNVLQPEINKDKWVPEERDLLQELAIKHEMSNWDIIAKELGTNRSAYQCLQYYQQNLNINFSSREWTEEEDNLLREVVENCRVGNRISWNQVCYFIEGRNWKQCQRRWIQIDPTTKRGRWSAEEDFLLLSAVHLQGTANWKLIQEMVPGRSAYQCRDRYTNCLNPDLKPPTTWTYEEDKVLLQLASKYTDEESSGICWTKIASEMEGRTDNMVLNRYKRLKSWKIQSDWLSSQNDETKAYLGTMFNKGTDGANTQEPAAIAIPHSWTFASGVQRDDYLKQIRDKQAGDIVVPRPPLSHKFSTRNMEQVWQRKLQLKKLVEHHLQKSLNKSVTSKDKMLIPSKTAKEFVPFVKLNKKQRIEMDDLFKGKDPHNVKVSDILAITNKFKEHENAATRKRVRRFTKDSRIDRKMADIIQMKKYPLMITRSGAGRPKKYNIFHPHGKVSSTYTPENVTQLTSVSTTLMLSALEVNGHKALENAQKKPEKEMTESEKEEFTMLKKLFPPLPASMKGQLASNSKLMTLQKVGSPGIVHSGPVTKGQSIAKAGEMSVEALQGLTLSVTNKTPDSSSGRRASGSKSVKEGTVAQNSIQTSVSVTSSEGPATSGNTTISSHKVRVSKPTSQPTAILKPQNVASSGLRTSERQIRKSVSRTIPQTVSHTPSLTVNTKPNSVSSPISAVQPPRVVVVQKKGTPTPSNIPLLPPGVKHLEAFAGLLVQFQLLTASAGSLYNGKYYANVTKQIRSSLASIQSKEQEEDEKLVKTVLDSFKNRSSAAVMRGAKHINKDSFSKSAEATSTRDLLSDVRVTPEYHLLQKRFESLFSWPALLSTIQGSENKQNQDVHMHITGKKARQIHRKKMQEKRPAEPEPDVDMGDLLAGGEEAFAAKIKKALVKKEKKRKMYPCTKGKCFYRNQLLDKEYRQKIIRKRIVTKRLNKELREKGISVNDMSAKAKPLKKRLHPTRQSSRIAKKANVVMPDSSQALDSKSAPKRVCKRNIDMDVLVKVEKLDQANNDQNLSDEELTGNSFQNDLGTGNAVIQDQNPSEIVDLHISDHESGTHKVIEEKGKDINHDGLIHSDTSLEDDSHLPLEVPIELDESTQGVYHSKRKSVMSSEQQPLGPSVTKKRKIQATENSESSRTDGGSIDICTDENDHTTLESVTPLQLNSAAIHHGEVSHAAVTSEPIKSSSASIPIGTGLQPSTVTGPCTVFPGMSIPSQQGINSVQSGPDAAGSLTPGGGLRVIGGPLTTGSPSNVAVPFTHPGLEGHLVFAIPVEQLAQSTAQMTSAVPNQEGVFPVTLLINTNHLTSFCSPARNSQSLPTDQIPVSRTDHVSASQTTESVTSNQTTESVTSNQTTESVTSNQTTESVTSKQTTEGITSNQTTEGITSNQTTESVTSNQTTETSKSVTSNQTIRS